MMDNNTNTKRNISLMGYSPFIFIFSIGVFIILILTKQITPNRERKNVTQDEIKSLTFFTSTGVLITGNIPQYNNGLALVDYDMDGKDEILVTGYGETRTKVLKYVDGNLVNISANNFARSNDIGVATCDMDGDGIEEIFISTGNFTEDGGGFDHLYHYQNNKWSDIYPISLGKTDGRDVVCLDSDGDQLYELVQIDSDDFVRHLAMDKNTHDLHLINDRSGINLISNGKLLLAMPLTSTAMDLIISTNTRGNVLLKNDGEGRFSEFSMGNSFTQKGRKLLGLNYIDANGDGLLDLIETFSFDKRRILIQQDDFTFKDILSNDIASTSKPTSTLVSDFDLNGIDDILFLSSNNENLFLTGLPNGFDTLPIGELDKDENITGGVVGLINDNNIPDILLGHKNKSLTFYEAYTTKNNFIAIKPKTRFGAPARGTIVKISTKYGTQTKILDTGSGYYSQGGDSLYFGLADSTIVKRVEIVFPSGSKKILKNIQAGKVITVKSD